MKKILCFGGGNAMPKLILPELKKRRVSITTITSMTDSGGSTGQLRQDFGILPPGDMRRHLLALSDAPEWKKELFKLRFGHEQFDGGHKGHVFGNIFIGGLEYILKDYEKALKIAHEFLEVNGTCLPATIQKTNLAARLENEEEIVGENEIDAPKKHSPQDKIAEVYLSPEAKAYPPVIDAINSADLIIIGPGDLYSSIIPCFLPKGIKETMQKTKAKKVFICPAMTKLGETQNMTVVDIAKEAEKYIGCRLDCILYNTEIADKKRIDDYKREEPRLVGQPGFEDVPKSDKYAGKKLLIKSGSVVYDPGTVAGILLETI